MEFDIIDYLGKSNEGIIVLLSLSHEEEFYDATFYYKGNLIALTPDEELETKLGDIIEKWEGYNELVLNILRKLVPYDEMIVRLDEIDFTKYGIDINDPK